MIEYIKNIMVVRSCASGGDIVVMDEEGNVASK